MTARVSGPPRGLRESVALTPLTALELGGPARYLAEADSDHAVVAALWRAADRGLEGLVLRIGLRGVTVVPSTGSVPVPPAGIRFDYSGRHGPPAVTSRTTAGM